MLFRGGHECARMQSSREKKHLLHDRLEENFRGRHGKPQQALARQATASRGQATAYHGKPPRHTTANHHG